MGEVGANATETTKTAPTPAADSSSSSSNTEPKENGEVNGTDTTTAPTSVATGKDVSALSDSETVDKEEVSVQEEEKETEQEVAKNGTNGEADTEKAAHEQEEEVQLERDSSTAVVAVPSAGEERLLHKEADDSGVVEAAELLEESDADAKGKTDPSSGGDDSKQADLSKRPDESVEQSIPVEEVETMDVDDDDGDVVAVEAENGTPNGAAEEEEEDGDEKEEAVSKENQSKVVPAGDQSVTEIDDDDEPMEVDGDAAVAPTNGHTEPSSEPEKLGSSQTATEKQPSKDPLEEDEEDDDKPVSINSDSDNEEEVQQKPSKGEEAAKPAGKLIVVESNTQGPATAAAAAAAPVGGEVAAAKAKSGDSKSVPSNGMDARNQNGDCDGDFTILSDKEDDCVVIEDDDGESDASLPTTPANNSRRIGSSIPATINPIGVAALQQQQLNQSIVSSMDDDDDDDDIEEIIDDPLSLGGPTNLSMSGRGFPGSANVKVQKSLLMNNSSGVGGGGGGGGGGKEPTLVLIDTNTMMNNGGAQRVATNLSTTVPNVNSNAANLLAKASNVSPGGQFNSRSLLSSPGVASAAGAMLNQQGSPVAAAGMLGKNAASALTPVTPLLPALTDDMFVLEAPSFIVPYIYEKPPVDNLRDIVDELEVKIKEMRKKLEESGAVPPANKQAEAATASSSTDQGKQEQNGKGKDAMASIYGDKDANKNNKKRKRNNDDDDDWDELETSTDDEASDEEQKTKVLIKEANADIEAIKEHIISPADKDDLTGGSGSDPKKSENYFENPLGKFFMNIGINLVQEFVQTDLLRQQKRKRDREGKPSPSTQLAINSLMKNLEQSKENNKPYKFEMKRCEYCPFKSESALVMAHHYETPHMRNFIYKCNFCAYETRPPHDILYHMEAVHNIKGRMEKALSYHHCPNCPFEDNGKSKLARHAVACAKKFRPEMNLNPPIDWEPPAKIPRIKPKHGLVGTATAYQAMTAQQQKNIALANQQRLNQQGVSPHLQPQHLTHTQQQQLAAATIGQQHLAGLAGTAGAAAALNSAALASLSPASQAVAMRARAAAITGGAGVGTGVGGGRAPAIIPSPTGITGAGAGGGRSVGAGATGGINANALAASAAAIRNTLAGAGMVIPNNLQLSASALAAAAAAAGGYSKYLPKSLNNAGRSLLTNSNASITIQNASSMKATKTAQAPSISITPLPRQSSSNSNSAAANMSNIAGALSKLQAQGTSAVKPGQSPSGGKMAFVVCEICDGYIKDLDQLRNHMQWIHKVKIHPKMIYNRPPLNCQKCQYRFFTDQGLERHLLGSHGLVTSSMQEAANKGKDAGRCPVCGRVYQWKLLNHVSRDHNMTLKPAHLSYKCTVCTATFGMYKQFESHVYSAHSTVAKKTGEGKGNKGGSQSSSGMGGGSSSSGSGGGLRNPFVGGGDSLLKPLKINDEITIIPQPTSNSKMSKTIELESHVID